MHARRLRGALARYAAVGLAAVFVVLTATEASAQYDQFVPYYGKNRIKYDHFDWHIYTTDHFEIYYYPEIEPQLERVASYAESAYQQISADLKHDLAAKVPMVLFKTQSEFQQQNIEPGELPEGVLAFAEPQRDRMVLPLDQPSDELYVLITHELTHVFEFDIIPRSLIRRGVPLWVDEGLADYEAGTWNPIDLMVLRDAALADIVPRMSDFETAQFSNARLPYLMGHAAFEFMESKWGKEGIRQFLFALRKNVVGGGNDSYQEAFRIDPDDFDDQFDKYLKERFKPFRDLERPTDYGKNLAPKPEKTPYVSTVSIEPSPSGDLLAVAAGNRKDQELDIILVSSKDGKVIRDLTKGFDIGYGWEHLSQAGGQRFNTVPWMAWAPAGDRLAYFVRTEKWRSLILQNVVTRKVEKRYEITSIDAPESPAFDPTGRKVAFAGLREAVPNLFELNLDSGRITNLTNDEFAEYAPEYSPDGKFVVYVTRVSGNDKLFKLDLATKEKTQLTFGTHDDTGAHFIDDHTIVFSSTASDPNKPMDPEVAKNGQIFNVWTLDLTTGELRRYTDTATAALSPVALHDGSLTRFAFVTYFKGDFGIHAIEEKQADLTVASSDFGAPGPIIDFQAPLQHTLVKSNERKKGTFEKMFLDGRPPVNVGVTNNGDIFGGTALTFSDVLGDQQFNIYASSIAQYRTLLFNYANLSRRFQWATQAYSQTLFYYGLGAGYLYDPVYSYISRDQAISTQTARGGSIFGIYPINRYARIELSAGLMQYKQSYNNSDLQTAALQYQQAVYGGQLLANGTFMPLGAAYVRETTVFRQYGPLSGDTMRLSYEYAPKMGGLLSRQTADLDMRYYMRIGTNGVLALRARGFKSWGDLPDYTYFGGNSQMRGYDYLQFIGNNGFFGNAELRFPLIEAMATPIGVLGGIRGVFFFDIGGAAFARQTFQPFTRNTETLTPIVNYVPNYDTLNLDPVYGDPIKVSGFRLKDARASYGLGLETFALGFPIHFDWSWRTTFNKAWEDYFYALNGGSSAFRKARFQVWIGYDF